MVNPLIRDYHPDTDLDALRKSVIELQDYERGIDARMPTGEEIVDEYIPKLLDDCEKYSGKIIVAEIGDQFAGFVSIWNKVPSEEIDEGDFEYGYVSDLLVSERFRGQGLGRTLLDAAESHARDNGVVRLRIAVLASNEPAHRLYRTMGFADHSIELEKSLP